MREGGSLLKQKTPERNKVEGRTHCYSDSGLCPPSLHRSTRPLEHPASCHSGKSEPRWAGQQEPTVQEKDDDALPCAPGGPDSDPPRLQQVGSAPSSLFFESLINFQETSPDNCHEAAPAKQTQTELSSTRLVT